MNVKKNLAAKVLRTTPGKVRFAPGAEEDIAKAITRSDVRGLIAIGKITIRHHNHQSRGRARQKAMQKRKGRQGGRGTKKGSKYSLVSRKEQWMTRIRVQRTFLRELRERGLLTLENYHKLYRQSKGGYFRNKRHIKLYLAEHNLIENKTK